MKTKSAAKKKYGKAHPSPAPRKRIEDRDLNEDDQNRRTNIPVDENTDDKSYNKIPQRDDLEEEEEREKKRKVADARGEEEN